MTCPEDSTPSQPRRTIVDRVQAKVLSILEEIQREGFSFDEAEKLGERLHEATGMARWKAMTARIGPSPFEIHCQDA